jgi:hypothetical protein
MFDVFVHNMGATWPALRPQMFVGGAGRGKTSLTKLVGQEIRDRLRELELPAAHFLEVYGGDLATDAKLDAVMRLASSRPGSVLFVDEVHSMPRSQRERLYMLMDRDWRFKFEGEQIAMPLSIHYHLCCDGSWVAGRTDAHQMPDLGTRGGVGGNPVQHRHALYSARRSGRSQAGRVAHLLGRLSQTADPDP